VYSPVDVIKNDVRHNRTDTSFFIVTTLQDIFIVVQHTHTHPHVSNDLK